jgi:N-acetylglucosamine kinase-like BadF-type ATPase
MESYYLGLDGGGTKTAAVILDGAGRELGRGTGGAGNIAQNPDTILSRSVQDAVSQACAAAGLWLQTVRFAGVCAGMAGYSAEERRHSFAQLLQTTVPAETVRLEPDYVIAYRGATLGEPGIVMIAGTGAVAYGCNAQGQTCKADGLGYLLGDRGSGFNLGMQALRHTVKQLRAGQADPLAQMVLERTGTSTQNEIVQWLYTDFHPSRVAALAPGIGALAEAGDDRARALVFVMALHLRSTVWQVRAALEMPRDIPVYPLGGLWQIGALLRAEFTQPQHNVRREGIDPRLAFAVRDPQRDAAYGAALLAKEQK